MRKCLALITLAIVVAALVITLAVVPGYASEINHEKFFVETDTGMKLMVLAKLPITGRLGHAVLLVHGSGVGLEYWDIPIRNYSVMNALAKRGLDVYAVQCRGYGESTKPNGMEVNVTNTAKDLKSVVSEIARRAKVGKVSIVGHSSGGTVVLMAAHLCPELIDRVVLMGAPYKKINPQFEAYAQKVIEMAKQPGNDYVPNGHHLNIEKRIDAYDEDVVAWYKKLVGEKYGKMPGGIYPDVIKNPTISVVPKIELPTLILNGSNEYVVAFDDALALFADIGAKDKSIIILPGGFHLMFLEKHGSVGIQESLFFWLTKK